MAIEKTISTVHGLQAANAYHRVEILRFNKDTFFSGLASGAPSAYCQD